MDDLATEQPATAAANEPTTTDDGRPIMRVKVYSPFKVYFDEPALSISAENETGPFDVLPRHHNFITLLRASEIVIQRTNEVEQRVRISGGIMHVKADHVVVFLDV